MSENPALKDMFNRDTVSALARAIAAEYPEFRGEVFLSRVFDTSWDQLALKARVRHITAILGDLLPGPYAHDLEILKKSLPHLLEQGFEKMVFPDYVEVYGLDDWDTSMAALEEFTKHVSGEFAIRPLIARYPEKTLARMRQWAEHAHPGIRRLASEGCRPRLPWGLRLNDLVKDPAPILPILEALKDDPCEDIRRSVANNLNDISKDHPEIALKVLTEWQIPEDEKRSRLVKHALRTLLKAGDSGALYLVGISSSPEIEVSHIKVEPSQISLGEEVVFSFEIHSTGGREQQLMIDYLVHFLRANGKHSPKVFKLTQKTIQPGEKIQITKKHGFQPITTRKYYPGQQIFQPQVNGKLFEKMGINLKL
jgi:3-methyladenine DNA glycosylase AlkC